MWSNPVDENTVSNGTTAQTVLLVETDNTLLESLAQLLENDGFRILVAHSGKAALSICEQHHGTIELLVTDVAVGLISGFDLAAAVATAYPDVTVVFIATPPSSLHNSECDVCRKAAAHFLPKPFMYSQLRNKIAQLSALKRGTTLEWLVHFQKIPADRLKGQGTTLRKDEIKEEKRREDVHPRTVQLEAVEQDDTLLVCGLLRHLDGTASECLIEPQIQTLRAWRTLRKKDCETLVQPMVRLLVSAISGAQLKYISPYKRAKMKEPSRNAVAFGLFLLAALYSQDAHIIPPAPPPSTPKTSDNRSDEIVPLAEVEKAAIISALTQLKGDKVLTARRLGIGRTTLYKKLKEYRIVVERSVVRVLPGEVSLHSPPALGSDK